MGILLEEIVTVEIDRVPIKIRANPVGACVDDIGAEEAGIAFIRPAVHVEKGREVRA